MTCSRQTGHPAPHRPPAQVASRLHRVLLMGLLVGLVSCGTPALPDTPTDTPASTAEVDGAAGTNTPTLIVTVPANTPVPTLAPTPFASNYVAGAVPTPDPPKPIKETGAFTTTYRFNAATPSAALPRR